MFYNFLEMKSLYGSGPSVEHHLFAFTSDAGVDREVSGGRDRVAEGRRGPSVLFRGHGRRTKSAVGHLFRG